MAGMLRFQSYILPAFWPHIALDSPGISLYRFMQATTQYTIQMIDVRCLEIKAFRANKHNHMIDLNLYPKLDFFQIV